MLEDKYSAKLLGLISIENILPSSGSPIPFPLVNVCILVKLLA